MNAYAAQTIALAAEPEGDDFFTCYTCLEQYHCDYPCHPKED